MSIKIYHNSRCSKSNAALKELGSENLDFTIVNYLENPPTVEEIRNILALLGIGPLALMRTNEAVFKEKIKGRNLSDEELIVAMHENPILIQRPIIINGDRAVIARSEEALDSIL